MNELALFAGAGGGILGGHLLGWRTLCAVERNPYAASVLAQRQNDRILQPFPIWDDVCTFDGNPWRGRIDVISGGFPCQDISAAGKGAGISGQRSGLWTEFSRIIHEVRPNHVFVENSPMLTSRGLGTVLGDLASLGFNARWCVLGANTVGAPHRRNRIWILANARSRRRDKSPQREIQQQRRAAIERTSENIPNSNTHGQRRQKQHTTTKPNQTRQHTRPPAANWREAWWDTEPDVGRVAHGVAARMDRLTAIGNGQVPAVAAKAWLILNETKGER